MNRPYCILRSGGGLFSRGLGGQRRGGDLRCDDRVLLTGGAIEEGHDLTPSGWKVFSPMPAVILICRAQRMASA